MIAQIDARYVKVRPAKAASRLVSYALFEGRPVTTKGRWINPVIKFLFAMEKRLPIRNRVKNPVFIVGTGRSGTTILGIVLSMHRDVGFLNEPKSLWNSIYPHEDIIGSYSLGDASYRLDATHVSADIKQAAQRLFSFYLLLTRSSRLVDKYPELIFRVPFVREIFPDAKFLFLVRNGWDTCHSIEHWSQRLGMCKDSEVHDWWGVNNRKWNLLVDQLVPEHPLLSAHCEKIRNLTRHVDMAAVEWILTMREGLEMQKKYPESIKTVYYEKLASNIDDVVPGLLDFCELEPDDKFLKYARTTMKPAGLKPPFELDPVIRPAFDEQMRNLGYTT